MTARCETVREWMLTADALELRAPGKDPRAEHLRCCANCQALAQEILEAERKLSSALDALRTPGSIEGALDEIRGLRQPRRAVQVLRWTMPFAAAAAALSLFLGKGPESDPRPPSGAPPHTDSWDAKFSVEAPAGQTILVFEAASGSAKVIWFYGSEE